MRAAEWIHLVVFPFFVSLAWMRTLPEGRRTKVTGLGLAGVGATLTGAFLLPALVPALAASVVRDWLPALLVLFVYWQAGAFFVRVDQKFQDRLQAFDARVAAPVLRWLSRNPVGRWVAGYLELCYLLCYPMVPMSVGALYVLRLGGTWTSSGLWCSSRRTFPTECCRFCRRCLREC